MNKVFLALLLPLACAAPAFAQIPASTSSAGDANYRVTGDAAQPFTVELVDVRRTVSNTVLLRLALTNNGASALVPGADFALPGQAKDLNTISAVYVVDPNGQGKFGVLRAPDGKPLCSSITPALQPGERRMVYAQLSALPDTSSALTVVFPKAKPIVGAPVGLPSAGEALPPEASIGDPGKAPAPSSPLPPTPSAALDQPGTNYRPDVYTNQTGLTPPGSKWAAVGTIQSANSTTPFTVVASGVQRAGDGRSVLNLTLTNNGSGLLEAAGQFTGGVSDPADSQTISGVYLVEPKTKQRFEVARETQTRALCSKIDTALRPGESRALQAEFPALPAGVGSVYVYFPHAAPIADVPITQ